MLLAPMVILRVLELKFRSRVLGCDEMPRGGNGLLLAVDYTLFRHIFARSTRRGRLVSHGGWVLGLRRR